MVEVCEGPNAVHIVPYYNGSDDGPGYHRSLAVDLPPNAPGFIVAEGRRYDMQV